MNDNFEERPEDALRRIAGEAQSWRIMAENVNRANQELIDRSLTMLQVKVGKWRRAAYPDTATVELQALGVAEEVGELCHAVLKFKQGIRGYDYNKTRDEVKDALGDIIIYAMGVADRFDINVEDALVETVNHVISRNITQGSDMGKGRPDDAGCEAHGEVDGPCDAVGPSVSSWVNAIHEKPPVSKVVDYAGHVPSQYVTRLPQDLTEEEKAIARQAIAAMKDKGIPGNPTNVEPIRFHGDTV
jgi:NTP pyrophosphatase (non-canonical NTP hydrolase)